MTVPVASSVAVEKSSQNWGVFSRLSTCTFRPEPDTEPVSCLAKHARGWMMFHS